MTKTPHPTPAQAVRLFAASDILQGMSDGIDGDRLQALMEWAIYGKPADMDALERIFTAPWIAAAEEADWEGDPRAEARKDIARLSEAAGRASQAQGEPVAPLAYAYRYHNQTGGTVLRFDTNGREINGSKPIEAIPLYAHPPARADEWRPIETAPRDGTAIDVWRPEGGRDTVFWGFPHHECGEMGRLCDSDWHSIKKPGWVCNTFGEFIGGKHAPFTHWRPLPEPPRPAQEGA